MLHIGLPFGIWAFLALGNLACEMLLDRRCRSDERRSTASSEDEWPPSTMAVGRPSMLGLAFRDRFPKPCRESRLNLSGDTARSLGRRHRDPNCQYRPHAAPCPPPATPGKGTPMIPPPLGIGLGVRPILTVATTRVSSSSPLPSRSSINAICLIKGREQILLDVGTILVRIPAIAVDTIVMNRHVTNTGLDNRRAIKQD